jgi:ferredoxin
MRHIEAEDIHARIHELADHFGGVRDGAKGGNDFSVTQQSSLHINAEYFSRPPKKRFYSRPTMNLACQFPPGQPSSPPNFLIYFMADAANKYPENAAGKYFVDNQCIDCDLCRETAPANFKRNDDGGYSVVYKQPASPDEEKLCKEAMEGCPVEAIGNNG